jgi:hypothetical protein
MKHGNVNMAGDKKPGQLGVYLIAIWFFVAVAFLVYPVFDYTASFRSSGEHMPLMVQGIWVVTVLFLVAELLGLILLHPLSRLIYLVLISFWTLVIGYNLQKDVGEQTITAERIVWSVLFLLCNIASVVYLMQPRIRKLWTRKATGGK